MEFKCLTNIETSFRQLRMYALVFAGICAVVTVAAVWMSYSFAERQRQKIYVLDGGRSLMVALSQDLSQNRPVEAREHIRRFHELFFTLSPDRAAMERFRDTLTARGITTTIRASRGEDIQAACGLLSTRGLEGEKR